MVNLPDITKSMLYNKIWNTSYEKAVKTDKLGMRSTDKGYSLAIDGLLYQGMYDSYIDVIGDKMGGDTSIAYFTDPTEFGHRLNKLHSITNTELMIMASHQTFSGQLWHLTDQTKFDQINLLYIINGEVNDSIIGKQMSGQFSTLIINTANIPFKYFM